MAVDTVRYGRGLHGPVVCRLRFHRACKGEGCNAEFRQVFSERLILFSKTVYAPETVQPVLDKYVNLMFYPIELETERYNFGEEEVAWQRGEYMRGFFEKRPESIKEIIESNFPDVTIE